MFGDVVARAASVVTRTEPPAIFTELGRHPRLFRSWLQFAGTLLLRGELPRRDTELVILRTAVNCDSRYEWVQHVSLAGRAGLSDDEITAAARSTIDGPFTWKQRLLLAATDELHRDRRISPITYRRLEHVLSDRQLLELCMLVGHYEMLAMTINTRGLVPEPKAIARLSPDAARVASRLTRSSA